MGLRYDGVKVFDLIGGSLGCRRPGYAISVEPGFQYERGKDTWSLNIPVAVQRNRKRSVPDQMQGTAGDAAFADYFITVGDVRPFLVRTHALPARDQPSSPKSPPLNIYQR